MCILINVIIRWSLLWTPWLRSPIWIIVSLLFASNIWCPVLWSLRLWSSTALEEWLPRRLRCTRRHQAPLDHLQWVPNTTIQLNCLQSLILHFHINYLKTRSRAICFLFIWMFVLIVLVIVIQDQNGMISWQVNPQTKKSLPFSAKKCESKMLPRVGDLVTFDVYQVWCYHFVIKRCIHKMLIDVQLYNCILISKGQLILEALAGKSNLVLKFFKWCQLCLIYF